MRYSERALDFTGIQGKIEHHKCIYVIRKSRIDCVSWSTWETPITQWWLMLSLPIQTSQSLGLAVYISLKPWALQPTDIFQRIALGEPGVHTLRLLSPVSPTSAVRIQITEPLLSSSRNTLTPWHIPPPSLLWMALSRALTWTLLLLGSLTPLPVGFSYKISVINTYTKSLFQGLLLWQVSLRWKHTKQVKERNKRTENLHNCRGDKGIHQNETEKSGTLSETFRYWVWSWLNEWCLQSPK